jgi:diguanylate cyclase (GGDEF)-like protein/PAS domain S-box-containing protein
MRKAVATMTPARDDDRREGRGRHLVMVLEPDGTIGRAQAGHLDAEFEGDTTTAAVVLRMVSALDRDAVRRAVRSVRDSEEATATVSARVRDRSGHWHHCVVTLVGIGHAGQRRVLIRVRDATDAHRRTIGDRLEAQILDNLPNAVVAVDDDALVVYWNRGAEALFGATRDDVLGRRIDTLTDRILPDGDLDGLLAHLSDHDTWEGDYTVRRPDGSTCPASLQIRRTDVTLHGFAGLIATAVDIRDRVEAREADALLALQDRLTGLPTRTLFVDQLDHALRRRNRALGTVGLVRLDIDEFHRINEEHGVEVGDALLAAIAKRLAGGGAPGSGVARVAGDGFVLLAERVRDADVVEQLGAQVLDLLTPSYVLADPDTGEPLTVSVRVSAGVTVARNGEGPETLMRNAEAALVAAKAHGGACVRRFDDELHHTTAAGAASAQRLRQGIAAGEIEIWFQPTVELATGHLAGFEALARWRRDGELVPPDEFIPVAEGHQLIGDIGGMARAAAIDLLASWPTEDVPFVAVNISPLELTPCLLERVREALTADAVAPERLVLELTESMLVDDMEAALVEQLRALGVGVAIDDFGTGYSSLTRLVSAPVDELKLDRSFVEGMLEDRTTRAVVTALVSLGRDLGIRVVAEGVETDDQREELVAMGCELAQGFLWSPAVPRSTADEMAAAPGPIGQANGSAKGSS